MIDIFHACISDVDSPVGSTLSSSVNDPEVGHEKQSMYTDGQSGCGIDVTNTTPKFGRSCSSMRDRDLIGPNLSSDSCSEIAYVTHTK